MKKLLLALVLTFTTQAAVKNVLLTATASGTLGPRTFSNFPVTFQVSYDTAVVTGAVGSQTTGPLTTAFLVECNTCPAASVLGVAITGPVTLSTSGSTLIFSQAAGGTLTFTNPAIATFDLTTNIPGGLTNTNAQGPLTFATFVGPLSINAGATFITPILGPTPGQGTATVTVASIPVFNTTNKTAETDTYSTRITARLNNGALLYDKTLAVAFSDSSVQTTIAAARAAITAAAAGAPVTIPDPNKTSEAKTLTGTSSQTVDGTPSSVVQVAETLGPAMAFYGNNLASVFTVATGDANNNVTEIVTTPRTVTTTSAYLIAQTYEIAAVTQLTPTPLPPSLLFSLTGLAGLGLNELRRRHRRKDNS